MSTRGQFNTKNPTIKRILKEASELANNASADFHATPLEDNLFEWHFTIRGPPAPSSYANGIYHGRIVLPSAYPHRPPSFRFLTPSGRFEVNREICLSISGFHEETWQPAWGIRTALVAIRSFMDTGAAGQVGGLECDEESRKKMADQSRAWKCPGCSTTNEEIIKEREQIAKDSEAKTEETVPEELRLAYREDLGGAAPQSDTNSKEGDKKPDIEASKASTEQPAQGRFASSNTASINASSATSQTQNPPLRPTRTTPATAPAMRQQTARRNQNDGTPAWIDQAIYGVVAALIFFTIRKFL